MRSLTPLLKNRQYAVQFMNNKLKPHKSRIIMLYIYDNPDRYIFTHQYGNIYYSTFLHAELLRLKLLGRFAQIRCNKIEQLSLWVNDIGWTVQQWVSLKAAQARHPDPTLTNKKGIPYSHVY